MTKKITKHYEMQDMFIQQAITEKTALFEAASEKIQKEIDEIENSSEKDDSGLSSVEDRNEVLFLKSELRHLEERFYDEVSRLKEQNR